MKVGKIIRVSLKNLQQNKRRSALTMLGIVIGIFAVVIVMSAGAGAQSIIVGQIAKRGTDQIAILSGASDENGPPASALGIIVTTLTWNDGLAVLELPSVKSITGYITGNDIVQWRNIERSVTYTGATASYKEMEQVEMDEGRFFTEQEDKSADRVIVLGASLATEIFGNQDPVGQAIKLKKIRFQVIGVMKAQGAGIFGDIDNAAIIPLSVAQKQLLGVRHVTFLRARAVDSNNLKSTIQDIEFLLEDRHGEKDFSIRNISDALTIITTITDALRFFLIAIAGVSLFVGGVGVMNIMLIAVKEKTREIGIRKAVGAKGSHIRIQFLLETVLLTTIGTVIGFILGTLVAYGIAVGVQSARYEYEFVISLESVLIAGLIAIIVGLLFGYIPASRAAQLDPIDALRYE